MIDKLDKQIKEQRNDSLREDEQKPSHENGNGSGE